MQNITFAKRRIGVDLICDGFGCFGSIVEKQAIELPNEERVHCEVWTRVMGYYRPVSAFNKGKQSEYKDRKCFSENGCSCIHKND